MSEIKKRSDVPRVRASKKVEHQLPAVKDTEPRRSQGHEGTGARDQTRTRDTGTPKKEGARVERRHGGSEDALRKVMEGRRGDNARPGDAASGRRQPTESRDTGTLNREARVKRRPSGSEDSLRKAMEGQRGNTRVESTGAIQARKIGLPENPPENHRYVSDGRGGVRLDRTRIRDKRGDVHRQEFFRHTDSRTQRQSWEFRDRKDAPGPITDRAKIKNYKEYAVPRSLEVRRELSKDLKARTEAKHEADILRKSSSAGNRERMNRLDAEVKIHSRNIGETVAHDHVRRNFPGAERVYPPKNTSSIRDHKSRPREFDQVYHIPEAKRPSGFEGKGDLKLIIESKGGKGTRGTRDTSGGRIEQGSKSYRNAVIDDMGRTRGKDELSVAKRKTAEQLRKADRRGNVVYMEVHAPIKKDKDGTRRVSSYRVSIFDT